MYETNLFSLLVRVKDYKKNFKIYIEEFDFLFSKETDLHLKIYKKV